jgi:competence protein ComEC
MRLVPAALTCWAVTAMAIVWRAGAVAAMVCVAVAVCAVAVWRRARRRDEPLRATVSAIVLGAAVVGAGFAWAAAVRVDALDRHPVVALYGRSAVVTVAAAEQPRLLRDGHRVIFRAGLTRIGADEASGRVTVFAPLRDFAELSAGQAASFRAVFARPTRRDLSVAVLTATGTPMSGEASPAQRAAQSVRRSFAEAARAQLPPDQSAALPALVLGDTSMRRG